MFSFSNIFKKAALFGASTVAGVAVTGTIMVNPVQAATMSYRSEFSVTSNFLETQIGDSEFLTGDFSFTKTDLNNGFFSYKLTDLNLSAIGETLSLDDIRTNPTEFLTLNQIFLQGDYQKYQTILPSIIAGEDSNYTGDGNFPPEDFFYEFTGQEFFALTDVLTESLSDDELEAVTPLVGLANVVFSQGGTVSFTTTEILGESRKLSFAIAAVPEPATIFALGAVGVGLTATRRRRKSNKIKQKIAA